MTDRESSTTLKVLGVTIATADDPGGVIVVLGRSPATDKQTGSISDTGSA